MKEKNTFRPIPGLSREDEEKQLARILDMAQINLTRTEGHIRQLSEELYDLMETYGPKDKEALMLLHNTQSQLLENKRDLVRCQKARKKPYFGRIDFKDPKQPREESFYVGRVGISDSESEPAVIDWRAPLSSIYYENSLGPCKYVVQTEGTYEVCLNRKRTYEIADDQLKDFFDSDVVANDDLLTKYLAKSKKAVLGEIIATIQKEQNAIIRKSPKTNLIVQGVAGSGKTTVAMHRISYILYNYEDKFRPEDFYIIGSNRILLNYITSVLPELDVYGVSQMTMEQLFVRLLYEDWDPRFHHIRPLDSRDKNAWIKGSHEWFHDLERFSEEYENRTISKEEVRIEKNGVLLVDEETIKNYLKNNPRISMQSKINMLNEILLAKLENELSGKYVSYTSQEKKDLKRICRWYFGKDEWKGSIFELYKEFLASQKEKGQAVPFTENEFDLYDLSALAYLYKRIKETDPIREASHVIIDEAQDFGMMAYDSLSYCLSGCTYTIMGDVSQNIHFGYGLNGWKELQDLILTGPYDSFELLKKSYRNTVEISDFATEILRHGSFPIYPVEPVIRHGNDVRIDECHDEKSMLLKAKKSIKDWLEAGLETIAVICRDEDEASMVSSYLRKRFPSVNSDLKTAEFGSGIMVLPVEYTKGLEFDAVLIYHPSRESYPQEDSYVKLLYVAATRALHELTILHQGDLTDLIGKPVSKEKRMHSLENPMHKEARRYQKKETTLIEQEIQDAIQGEKELALRNSYLGPKPIVAQKVTGASKTELLSKDKGLKNSSSHRFGNIPGNDILRPKGHSRIDTSIRIVKKTRKYIDLISSYGILRLTPLEKSIIRVQFQKGQFSAFESGPWNYEPKSLVSWTAKEGKGLVEIATEDITIRISKKTGSLAFWNKSGKLLLAEKEDPPRQMEYSASSETWTYFNWSKKEKLFAKGILSTRKEPMNQKARYINFGPDSLHMPLLVSEYGYGIGIAANGTVLCCTIPMYGTYLYTDGIKQIDYYFLYGETYEGILELYKKISG